MSDANDRDEIDAASGEYVLGTLTAAERLAAEARVRSEPAFRAAVAAWERRLQPLADTAPVPSAVDPSLFDLIAARVAPAPPAGAEAGSDNVVTLLERSVSRWRVSTFLAGMAAAALLAVAIGDRMLPGANPHEFVAVLSMNGSAPAFVATVNLDAQTLVIRRVTDAAPADRSYELWAVPTGGMPKSLGVIEQAKYSAPLPLEPSNLTLAVSLEPKGGSKTGAPTGPIVFTGTLIPGT